jgi:hypothetical protein
MEVHAVDTHIAALLEHTIEFWHARAGKPFSIEDARSSVENVAGFFATLQRWKEGKENATAGSKKEAM